MSISLILERFTSRITAGIERLNRAVTRDKSLENKKNAQKTAILTKKSKIFIKAKLILSKSCLLGLVCLVICSSLRDVLTLISKYLGRTNFYSKTDSTGKFSNDFCLKHVQSPRRLIFMDFSFSNE